MPIFPEEEPDPGAVGGVVVVRGYEFRGFRFGTGTDYIVEEVEGLLSAPTARDSDIDKSHAHGTHPGVLLYGKRIIAFDLKITGSSSTIDSKLRTVRRIFQAPRVRTSKISEPLVFWRPDEPKKVAYVRCTKRDFPSNFLLGRGLAAGSVELQASDPLIYALAPSTTNLTLPPASTAGSVTASMLGDAAEGVGPILTIEGPATNPIIQNEDDDMRAVRMEIVLAATDGLRINLSTKVVEKRIGTGGAWVRDYSIVRADNEWWKLLPGENVINYNRTGSALASTLTISWQDAWV